MSPLLALLLLGCATAESAQHASLYGSWRVVERTCIECADVSDEHVPASWHVLETGVSVVDGQAVTTAGDASATLLGPDFEPLLYKNEFLPPDPAPEIKLSIGGGKETTKRLWQLRFFTPDGQSGLASFTYTEAENDVAQAHSVYMLRAVREP